MQINSVSEQEQINFLLAIRNSPKIHRLCDMAAKTPCCGETRLWDVEFITGTADPFKPIFERHVIQINAALTLEDKLKAFTAGLGNAVVARRYEEISYRADAGELNRYNFIKETMWLQFMSYQLAVVCLPEQEAREKFANEWETLRRNDTGQFLGRDWDEHYSLFYYSQHPPENEVQRIECLLSTINKEYANDPKKRDAQLVLVLREILSKTWPDNRQRMEYYNIVVGEISDTTKRNTAQNWLAMYLEGMAAFDKKKKS